MTRIAGIGVLAFAAWAWAPPAEASTVAASTLGWGVVDASSGRVAGIGSEIRLLPTLEQRRGRGGTRAGRAPAGRGRVGRAVPARRGVRAPGRRTVIVRGRNYYYPYFGGYPYYRYGFGYGYGYWGDPYYWGPSYGYYYGGSYSYTGSVRLKVKPRDAEVLVDGYYVGVVDEFDGVLQALRLEPGPKHIEVRAPGFETLTFDVRVLPGRKITYEADMRAGDPGPAPTLPPPPAPRAPARPPQAGVDVQPQEPDRAEFDEPPLAYGGVRLRVEPRHAQVFVDGFFVGTVDDFNGGDGLPLESGPQTIQFKADGYEPLEIQVRILPGDTITYEGQLVPVRGSE